MPLSKHSKLSVVFSLFALLAIISGLLITGVVQRSQSAHASGNLFIPRIAQRDMHSAERTRERASWLSSFL